MKLIKYLKMLPKQIILLIVLLVLSKSDAQVTYESAFPNIDFEFPVELQSSVDGTNRMFVVEQPGSIKVFPRDANVLASDVNTFLDITDRVFYSSGQEIGLLGLAFHPEFSNNKYFYVYYSTASPVSGISVRMVLSRFKVDSNNINLVDPNSEVVLFQFDKNQNNSNHNGGKIAFGPDGYLYISFGDGGGGNDPQGNGQNINTVFGSICRIDVDLDGNNPIESNPDLPDGNYEIPNDNPFVGIDGLDEIYAYGLRNTWKFSFDNATGRIWGGDVGQNAFEEINIITKGNNYGWSRFEAISVANSGVMINEPTEFPVFFYDRSQGDQSITGGYVYRGSEITSLDPVINSKYIFGDYVSGRVWALDYNPTTGEANSDLLFDLNGQFISSFGMDGNGEIYFSDYGSNALIYKIVDGQATSSGTAVNGVGNWQEFDPDLINGQVLAITKAANGDIYFGGSFNQVGALTANNIIVWNASNGWSNLGTGSNGTINALKIGPNGNLYVGGSFTEIGGISANNIAMYNGSNWSSLGSGTEGPVLALEIQGNGFVFAGGIFEVIGGISARNIGFWDGNFWNALTDQGTATNGTNNEIRALHFDDIGILYVGGNFDEAGGNIANRFATWDGTNWSTLGEGTSGFVQAIASTPTDVFIGGNFAIAGNLTVNRIARWNKSSSSWFSIENGVNNNVNTLLHDGNYLYAAGSFDIVFRNDQNIIVDNIARWSTSGSWEAMGTNTQVGVDGRINAMSFSTADNASEKIFAGGNFSRAGSINTSNAAIWNSDSLSVEEEEIISLKIYSEFSSKRLYVSGSLEPGTTIELFDILGRLVINDTLDHNSVINTIDVSTITTGMYIIRVTVDRSPYTRKVIIR